MTSTTCFLASGATIAGREHLRLHRNNEDAVRVRTSPAGTALVVSDGCSSSPFSDVGARLGALWIAAALEREAHAADLPRRVAAGLLDYLLVVARGLEVEGAPPPIGSLLFSFLAAWVGEERAVVFGAGDGVLWIDGARRVIDPGPENAPPYLTYALLGAPVAATVYYDGPTAALGSLLLATDGALELEPALIGELLADPRYAKNPSLMQRRLYQVADARLVDDTSLALLRRRLP